MILIKSKGLLDVFPSLCVIWDVRTVRIHRRRREGWSGRTQNKTAVTSLTTYSLNAGNERKVRASCVMSFSCNSIPSKMKITENERKVGNIFSSVTANKMIMMMMTAPVLPENEERNGHSLLLVDRSWRRTDRATETWEKPGVRKTFHTKQEQ